MSDTLLISDGTTVGTDELFILAAELGAATAQAEGWALRLQQLAGAEADSPVWPTEPGIAAHLNEAQQQAGRIVTEGETLRAGLISAAEEYGMTERRITAFMGFGAQIGAWAVSRVPPILALIGLATAVNATMQASMIGRLFGVTPARVGSVLLGWVQSNPSLLNNPGFVRLVRGAASAGDEFVMGVAGVALPAAVGIGSHLTAEQGAAAITALAAVAAVGGSGGALRETQQTVTQAGRARESTPPLGVAGLAERVPASDAGAPQIRIERYGSADAPRWVAYVTGTADFSPNPGTEPFDLTANVHATANGAAASERAVRDALAAAGAATSDEFLVVGHSQGGLVAARLAESSELNVVAYVNMGGPIGSVNTGSVAGLSLEHADDLVPALGGAAQPQPGLITVARAVLDESDAAAIASGAQPAAPFEAHGLQHYRETAALIDASDEARLQEFEQIVGTFVGEDPGVETRWRSVRVQPTG